MKTATISAFDPQALTSLKSDARAQDPAALQEAAKQFESLFTQMLLKSMREANKSFGESMFASEETQFYQDMFDDQMAVHLAQGKGLGLADMLMRQLAQATSPASSARVPGHAVEASGSAASPAPGPQPAAGSRQPRAALATGRDQFIRQMLPHAQAAAEKLGVAPHALIAQAALETGWGKSVPCTADGACSFNLFGIKAGSHWSGAAVNVPTLEFEQGIPVRKVDRFRAYDSPADSFMDYVRLIGGSARYENARGAGSDVEKFATALQQGGYATDPQYAQKIAAVAKDVRAAIESGEFKNQDRLPIGGGGGVRS